MISDLILRILTCHLQLSDEFVKINPCKKLPCLITKSGKVLCQSIAIIEYLEAIYPGR